MRHQNKTFIVKEQQEVWIYYILVLKLLIIPDIDVLCICVCVCLTIKTEDEISDQLKVTSAIQSFMNK